MRALLTLAMTAGLVAGCGLPAPNQSPSGPNGIQATVPQGNFSTQRWFRRGGWWPYSSIYRPFTAGFWPYGGLGAFGFPLSSAYLFSPYRSFYSPFFYPRSFVYPRVFW